MKNFDAALRKWIGWNFVLISKVFRIASGSNDKKQKKRGKEDRDGFTLVSLLLLNSLSASLIILMSCRLQWNHTVLISSVFQIL